MQPKVFVAAAFSAGRVTGGFDTTLAEWIENLCLACESANGFVFSSHRREQWGQRVMAPKDLAMDDLREMASADYVVALISEVPSKGVWIEIGHAVALAKPTLVIAQTNGDVDSEYIAGLAALNVVKIVRVQDKERASEEVRVWLHEVSRPSSVV